MRNIILADNQDITKEGCKSILEKQFELYQFTEVSGKVELISQIHLKPNSLIVLDYTLFDFQSINDLLILEAKFDQINWILFSDELSDLFLTTLLFNTKSFSVILKDSSKEEIITAFKEVFSNNRFISSHVSNILLSNSLSREKQPIKKILTLTEQDILKEMALGKSTKEISIKRNVSIHTVMTHRKNIFRKIEVNNVHEATKYAMKAGIVDLAEYYI